MIKKELYKIKNPIWKKFLSRAELEKMPVPKPSHVVGTMVAGASTGFILANVGRYWLESELNKC